MSGNYGCPVCGYRGLEEAPRDERGEASFEICPCCGTEFGYDDATRSYSELRDGWVARGAPWFSAAQQPPAGWEAAKQLREAGLVH